MSGCRRRLEFPPATPITESGVRLNEDDVSALVVYVRAMPVSEKSDKTGFRAHKVVAVQAPKVPRAYKKEETKRAKADTPHETFTLGQHRVSIKSGETIFIPGKTYRLVGIHYSEYKSSKAPYETKIGFDAKFLEPEVVKDEKGAPVDAVRAFPLLQSLPYDDVKVIPGKANHCAIIQWDQIFSDDRQVPFVAGDLLMPEMILDSNLKITRQGEPPAPGFNGGEQEGGVTIPPTLRVQQCSEDPADKGQQFVFQMYFGPDVVEQLCLPPTQLGPWMALARQFLPQLCGVVVGGIDADKKIGREDAFALSYPTVFLDVEKIVERVGIPIDAESIALFVPNVSALLFPQWQATAGDLDMDARVVNLCFAHGNATELVAMVGKGEARAYVVSNHIRDPVELCAMEMGPRVQCLLGKTPSCYAFNQPKVFAVYVVGKGVRRALR